MESEVWDEVVGSWDEQVRTWDEFAEFGEATAATPGNLVYPSVSLLPQHD